jgi:hypothetical protein
MKPRIDDDTYRGYDLKEKFKMSIQHHPTTRMAGILEQYRYYPHTDNPNVV